MTRLTFYEKPGCISNTRQKKLLEASGHTLELRNLLTHVWTPSTLRPFFGDTPVGDWFNRTAPRVKSGELLPDRMTEDDALVAMCADPILIRRPLMQVGDACRSGFDQAQVHAWIGLVDTARPVTDDCPRTEG